MIICPNCKTENVDSAKFCLNCGSNIDTVINTPIDTPKTKKCPYCAEEIKLDAIVCRFCCHDLEESREVRISSDEIVIYENQKENIAITNRVAFIKGKSWSIPNISSVAIYPIKKLSRSCLWKGIFWFGLILIFSSLMPIGLGIAALMEPSDMDATTMITTGFINMAIGILLVFIARIKHYFVIFNSGGRMEEVLMTKNMGLAENVTRAIESALSGREFVESFTGKQEDIQVPWKIILGLIGLVALLFIGGKFILPYLPSSQPDTTQITNTVSAFVPSNTPSNENKPTISYEQIRLKSLEIDLWPEYDQPGVLVIYKISLLPETTLPVIISLRLPKTVNELNALAARQSDGTLFTADYQIHDSSEWKVITFSATTHEVQLEYYDLGLNINGDQRSFSYQWLGDYLVNSVALDIQQPSGAEDFTLLPTMNFSTYDTHDGLRHYRIDKGSLSFGQSFEIDMDYQKHSDNIVVTSRKGEIIVKIVNGNGGNIPSDLPVTLYGFDNMNQVFTETVKTSTDHYPIFSNVDMPVGRVFLAVIDYQNATYGSDIVEAKSGTRELIIPLTIYESITDTTILSVDKLNLFFYFTKRNMVHVVEVYTFSNPSNRTVTSNEKGGSVLVFNIPSEYINLQFQDGALGQRYIEIQNGFADTQSVQPGMGSHSVMFEYEIPYKNVLDFSHLINYPVKDVEIMLPDVGVSLESDKYIFKETRDMQGELYQVYGGEGLDAGNFLTFRLYDQP